MVHNTETQIAGPPEGKTAPADTQVIINKALARIGDLATLPEVTVRIIQVVENPKSTAKDLHHIIRTDPALSAKLLKVVNSAFYGLPGQVATVERAIVLLGMSAVKNLAVASSISRLFRGVRISEQYSAKDLWRHSLAVAALSRMLAQRLKPSCAEEIFLAGLIHDLGVLVERQAHAQELATVVDRVQQGGGSICAIEREVIGVDHQAFGLGLAMRWRFPRTLQAVTGYHHEPDNLSDELYRVVALVRLADVACCQLQLGFPLTCAGEQADAPTLAAAGVKQDVFEEALEQLPDALKRAEGVLS
jgi:HD-like signal output (HDOD) protein